MRLVLGGVLAVLAFGLVSGVASAQSGAPPAGGLPPLPAPQGYPAPQGSAPQGSPPQGYPPAPQGYAQPPQGYSQPPVGYPPPGYSYPPYYGERREMEDEIDAESGRAPPAGYHLVTRYRKGLVITGPILLGVGYLPALSVGVDGSNGAGWLVVPALGPFLQLATRSNTACDPSGDCAAAQADDAAVKFLLTFDGLLQLSGAALLIIGIAAPKDIWVRDYSSSNEAPKVTWSFAPTRIGRDGNGVAVSGAFLGAMVNRQSSLKPRVLYVSYDGMCDHIAESQVLPYVLGLARRGWPMTLVSHEKAEVTREKRGRIDRLLRADGVEWLPQPYLRGNPIGALGLHVGMELAAALRSHVHGRFGIVHARSYIPAMSAALLKTMVGSKMLFDMRGFWLDEKVDAGAWSRGRVYRTGKKLERAMFGQADAIVSLTHAAKRELETWSVVRDHHTHIEVIPTCLDLTPYRSLPRRAAQPGPLLAYLGSFGARYLSDEMMDIFARVRKRAPDARLLVLSNSPAEDVERARERYGVPRDAIEVTSAPHDQVPARLREVDATFCLIKTGFAVKASCPTKFGESLAAGAPVIVNRGVGDCDEIADTERVGVVVTDSRDSYDRAVEELLALLNEGAPMRQRCERVAAERFDLERAIDAFESVYGRMLSG